MVNNINISVIDCQTTGISGDKFLSTLIDLGADIKKIERNVSVLENYLEGVSSISLTPVIDSSHEIRATRIQVKYKEIHKHLKGKELIQATQSCLAELKISEKAKKFALSVVQTLVNTEAKIHNTTLDDLLLHEAGSADTLIDSIGSAVCLDNLNLFNNVKWFTLPIAVGSGNIKFSHGLVSAPAPATLEILSANNIAITGGAVNEELTTPTGAAIIASLKLQSIPHLPNMSIKSIGYGAGTKIFPGIPNIMRLIIGHQEEQFSTTDNVVVLETNLDDISGEILGHTIKMLIEEGNAKDVSIIPTITKKNRPGHILKIITDPINEVSIVKILMKETGTLGVRIYPCKRFVLNREKQIITINVNNKNWEINVKVVKDASGEIFQVKPEFDDIIYVAKNTNLPARIIEKIAIQKIQSIFS